MKTYSYRNLIPKDPNVINLIRRISLVILIYSILGTLVAVIDFIDLSLVMTGLILASCLFGFLHILTLEVSEDVDIYNQLGLTSVITLAATLALLIPISIIGQSPLIALSATFFILPSISEIMIKEWDNKPTFTPKKAAVLPWLEAFVEGILLPSRNYIIFEIHQKNKRIIGYSIETKRLYEKSDITLQRLFSNWVLRYNSGCADRDIIATTFYSREDHQEHPIQWSFYRSKLHFLKQFYDPEARFVNLHVNWYLTLTRIEGRKCWIRALKFKVTPHMILSSYQIGNQNDTEN